MGTSIFNEYVVGYKKGVKTEFMYNSAFENLIPRDKMLEQNFGEVKLREVSVTGGTVPYDGAYPTTGGAKIYTNWRTYKHDFEGSFNFIDDTIAEIQSFLYGTEPSIFVGVKQYIGQVFSIETDRLTSSTFYSQILEDNKLKDTFKNGFYPGLDEIGKRLTNAKVPRNKPVYVYVNASTYAKQAAEARQNMILANTKTIEINDKGIIVTKDVLQYGRFIIIEVPDDVLQTKVTKLDGVSFGQETGGVVVAEDSSDIQALIIPDGCAYVDNQYMTTNIWYNPLVNLGDVGKIDSNITDLIGDFRINQIGANPNADAFAIKGRVINGRSIYDVNKKYCFSVEETVTP